MKRPRSYGEDQDDDVSGGEKGGGGSFKDWARRGADQDRNPSSSSSSHRRFYHSSSSGNVRKDSISSGYKHQRSVGDDRGDVPPRSRKRSEYELDSFDRRGKGSGGGSGGVDRCWDSFPERQMKNPPYSPRLGYNGGDRIRRSESFSASRRDFVKGFRSGRERERSEGSSRWRRSFSTKEGLDDDLRVERVRVGSEDRCRSSRSKDESSGGEPTRSVEVKKESGGGGGSEMEEGELEPDPAPKEDAQEREGALPITIESKVDVDGITESGCRSSTVERIQVEEYGIIDSKGSNIAVEKIGKSSDDECQISHGKVGNGLGKKNRGIEEEDDDGEAEVISEEAKVSKINEAEDLENVEQLPSCTLAPADEQLTHAVEPVVEEVAKFLDATPALLPSKVQIEKKNLEGAVGHAEIGIKQEKQVKQNGDVLLDDVQQKDRLIDLEAEPVNVTYGLNRHNEGGEENIKTDVTLQLLTRKIDTSRSKGKSLAISLTNETHSVDNDDEMEGPSSRGFELFSSESTRLDKVSCSGINNRKTNHAKLNSESLDLSLGLPGLSSNYTFRDPDPKPNSPGHARSVQSLPSSFRTNSDGLTASISMSGSQTFLHNPSCSLTHNSMDNYEHSVGSRPIFQCIDQLADGTVWQGRYSNEMKNKGPLVPFHQRMLQSSNIPNQSALDGHLHPRSIGMFDQPSFAGQSSYAQGPHRISLPSNKEKKVAERNMTNGTFSIEQILISISSEPLLMSGRIVMVQCMTEKSESYFKDAIEEVFANKSKQEELRKMQETLLRRSDLTLETLTGAQRVLLEILVSLKTGLPDFLRRASHMSSSDLSEVYMNIRCRNLACRGAPLPIDECTCKVCTQNIGFCSNCMCLLCSKFDMASNTCSWVGCDNCIHWCHTDCALQNFLIKNGRSSTGSQGTQMQFSCVGCNRPSEMFGFVKDVFTSCSKDWNAETLGKELEYVRRIFLASDDLRGKRLSEVAANLLPMLGNESKLSEVHGYIMSFFAGKIYRSFYFSIIFHFLIRFEF